MGYFWRWLLSIGESRQLSCSRKRLVLGRRHTSTLQRSQESFTFSLLLWNLGVKRRLVDETGLGGYAVFI